MEPQCDGGDAGVNRGDFGLDRITGLGFPVRRVGQMTNNQRRAPGRRTRAEAAHTRARIARGAERLFARNGYHGVPLRELARACGVRMFTIQHHFGSKLGLYREIIRRGDRDVRELLGRLLDEEPDPRRLVGRIMDELFEFFLRNRDWVALNARAALGENLPGRGPSSDLGWVDFMGRTMRERGIGTAGLDPRLLLITVEGILNNHALGASHHRHLFGRVVTDPELAAATKEHLKQTILAILDRGGAS